MLNVRKEYLEELLRVFEAYCPAAEIWAYGSRVNGDSHSGSDLDMTVVSFNDAHKSVAELRRLLSDTDIPFLMEVQEFGKLPASFREEIMKNYVRIFPAENPPAERNVTEGS